MLTNVSPALLEHALGIVALLYTVYKLWERRSSKPTGAEPRAWQAHVVGSATAIASALANAGGPIFTIYLLMLRVTPAIFVGTSVLYFALVNALKLPIYVGAHILTPDSIIAVAWAIPLVPFGVWTGVILDRYIDMHTFENIILVLLALTGGLLLLK